jgi:hypothetical protein
MNRYVKGMVLKKQKNRKQRGMRPLWRKPLKTIAMTQKNFFITLSRTLSPSATFSCLKTGFFSLVCRLAPSPPAGYQSKEKRSRAEASHSAEES